MPASPDYAMVLAKQILAIFSESEELLLARIAARLARGIDEPNWVDLKLLEIQAMRLEIKRTLANLEGASAEAIELALRTAYNRGVALAGTDLLATGAAQSVAFGGINIDAVEALVDATVERVQSTGLRIRRQAADIYTSVIQQTSSQVLLGTQTRADAARAAMAQYARSGVTGFVDKSGRHWDLASYAEMSTRTAAGQALVQGHVDKLKREGLQLVIVSNAPEECKICRPWEGKVLALTASALGQHSGPNLRGSGTVTVTVEHTLAQATADGLFHPNCRHSTSLYQVGVTVPLVRTADPEGDRLRQRQRALERRVRETKRAELVEKAWESTFAAEHGKSVPNPFTAKRREASAKRQAASDALKDFIVENDRKDLGYRTSLRAR